MQIRKNAHDLQDVRSQGRKRLRAVLWEQVKLGIIPFACRKCGKVPTGYNAEKKLYDKDPALTRSNNLDAQHINKDITDDDPANGEWLCRSCHKLEDLQTEKGVSLKENEFGYDLSILDSLE